MSFLGATNAHALCVHVSTANLRQGPGSKYIKSWEVYRYMPLRRIGKKGSWYKVKDVDGDAHWVYRKLITNRYRCAVVKASKASLRTGPGSKYRRNPREPFVKKYATFRAMKFKGSWVSVKDEYGGRYWIHRSLLWVQ